MTVYESRNNLGVENMLMKVEKTTKPGSRRVQETRDAACQIMWVFTRKYLVIIMIICVGDFQAITERGLHACANDILSNAVFFA